MNALSPLGMVSELPSSNQNLSAAEPTHTEVQKDYFVEKDGVKFAGTHLLIDLWDFAAIDIFMCGACNPYHGLPALKAAFLPRSVNLGEQRRGLIA